MLPDLPSLKEEIESLMMGFLRRRSRERLGAFAKAQRQLIHEGDKLQMERADGTSDISEMKEVTSELKLKTSDLPAMSMAERLEKLDQMADQMAGQMSAHAFQTLGETLDKAGQTTERKGKPFDAEAILEALDKIQMDFDEPPELSLVIPPALKERAAAAFEQLENDPQLRARRDEIISKKRREWRDREADRKLVG